MIETLYRFFVEAQTMLLWCAAIGFAGLVAIDFALVFSRQVQASECAKQTCNTISFPLFSLGAAGLAPNAAIAICDGTPQMIALFLSFIIALLFAHAVCLSNSQPDTSMNNT